MVVAKYNNYYVLELRTSVSPVVLGNHHVKQVLNIEDLKELEYSACCTATLVKLQQTKINISYVTYGQRQRKKKGHHDVKIIALYLDHFLYNMVAWLF